jgi:hypothetical protein
MMIARSCANCAQPIPQQKRAGTIYCGESACLTDRARQRQEKGRRKPEHNGAPRTTEPGDAGTAEWCAFSGFTPADLARHHIDPYSTRDAEEIKALYPSYAAKGVITNVVRQSGGLMMPKFPLPEHGPIPVQLDPDKPVATDPRVKWLRHDRILPEDRKVLALLRRNGRTVLVPSQWVTRKQRKHVIGYEISLELAQEHIERCRTDAYDCETGEGDHGGVNVQGWHKHAPRKAKYVNFGRNQRIDVGPDLLEAWLTAPMALLILEGKKKHLAAEAHGWATASVLSITMWARDEVRWLARWIMENNPDLVLFVVPDGDWTNFKRNRGAVFRQAMYVLTELGRFGVHAFMLTTPVPDGTSECECDVKDLLRRELPFVRISDEKICGYCGGYLKAFDDWFGAGGASEDLVVHNRELPLGQINVHVFGLPVHGNAKPGLARALCGLSLHDRDGCDLLNVPLKTLQRIMCARRPQDVPRALEDIDALTINGSLEIEKRPFVRTDGSIGTAWDWERRPEITVRDQFRAIERTQPFGEFRRDQVTAEQYIELTNRVTNLERRADERDQRDTDDAIAGLEAMLAEEAEPAA